MKLEVGMYVRTEYGISKIINIFPEKRATFIETDNGLGNCSMSSIKIPGGLHKGIYLLEEDYEMFIENNVKKTIIDLIEVGDYVNGVMVESMNNSIKPIPIPQYKNECGEYIDFDESEIKSIVTKEQFSQMEYKVGD